MLEHRFAKLAALATFALLVIGGTVNPTGSSLACPEPTLVCHGQLFPPMVGGVFYEHGHRLAAMTVGLLQIALTYLLFTRRPYLRRLAFLLLGLVVAQGALGAITVAFKLPWFVSSGHLVLGMSYFATLIFVQDLHMVHRVFGCVVAIVTSIAAFKVFHAARSWSALRTLALLAPVLVLAQVGLGIATVLSLRYVPLAVGHFAGAASLWALWMSALLLTGRRQTEVRAVDLRPSIAQAVSA
ncbi:MAG: COX15/CtaA family protein [Proteobacteria bacterium]|nr:COX15/CtaA family protein [Pseudomonadota bacterium]